jgi:hypothetical protein
LVEKPQRKKKCPFCGNFIFVRKGILFTEQQALDEDAIARWFGYLLPRGLDRQELEYHHQKKRKYFESMRDKLSQQFGHRASVNDSFWFIFNETVLTEKNLESLVVIFQGMAALSASEGKDAKPYINEAKNYQAKQNRSDLMTWKESVAYVRIYSVNDQYVCKDCQKLDNKRLRIEEALEIMPIPHACTNPTGCRCCYVPD